MCHQKEHSPDPALAGCGKRGRANAIGWEKLVLARKLYCGWQTIAHSSPGLPYQGAFLLFRIKLFPNLLAFNRSEQIAGVICA